MKTDLTLDVPQLKVMTSHKLARYGYVELKSEKSNKSTRSKRSKKSKNPNRSQRSNRSKESKRLKKLKKSQSLVKQNNVNCFKIKKRRIRFY